MLAGLVFQGVLGYLAPLMLNSYTRAVRPSLKLFRVRVPSIHRDTRTRTPTMSTDMQYIPKGFDAGAAF